MRYSFPSPRDTAHHTHGAQSTNPEGSSTPAGQLAMGSVHECPICNHYYNAEGRKPLCLPCGHTACRTCLLRFGTKVPKTCPTCRREWRGLVDDLTVIWQLIPGWGESYEEEEKQPHPGNSSGPSCQEHGYAFDFWCSSCHTEVCKKCLIQTHRTCRTTVMEEVVQSSSASEAVAASFFLKQSLSSNMTTTKTAASRGAEFLATVTSLLNVVSGIRGQLEAEQADLRLRKNEIEKMGRNVSTPPAVWTPQHKRQVFRWATEYHHTLGEAQLPGNFTPLQLQKLTELCNFAKSFQFPRRQQQQQQRGWFRWW